MAEGPRWIQRQREVHRPDTRALSRGELSILEPFFGGSLVSKVRVATVNSIPNPDFYALIPGPAPLDFTQMSGITFDDTILVSEARPVPSAEWLPLLFHELVHVVQYELLGVHEFVRRYVTGWAANGFTYLAIPLERDAYALDIRFRRNPHMVFSAPDEVAQQLALHG